MDVFFYTRLGPVGIPVPDRLVDLRVLLEGVVTAAGDEDGLAVVFFHLVFEPERDFDRGLVRTGGIDDLMKLLVALGVFQQLARLLIGFHLLEPLAELFDLFELAKVSVEGGNAAFQCVRKVIVPPDSVFPKALGGWYDMVVCMYHDQGHIPLKTVGFVYDRELKKWKAVEGVNVTLGLPIIRASVDHGTNFGAAGQANTTELCINHAMYDVQLADETLAKLCDEGFDYITVEPNTRNGQTEAIKTVGSQQCVLCSANLDEEVAYAITKAMCENTDVLTEASAALGYFDPSVAGTKALTGCDLHPGALRYYMEMGYINENGEAAK